MQLLSLSGVPTASLAVEDSTGKRIALTVWTDHVKRWSFEEV